MPVCDIINIEISDDFLINPFLCMTKKSDQEQKELLTWNKNHFLSFWKRFQESESVSDPRVSLSYKNCIW